MGTDLERCEQLNANPDANNCRRDRARARLCKLNVKLWEDEAIEYQIGRRDQLSNNCRRGRKQLSALE